MQATVHLVEIPFRDEYRSATQADELRRSLIVEVHEDDWSGWGEFPELPGYSPETVETAVAAITGKPVIHSNPLAIAAARSALADLQARRAGKPMAEFLGAAAGPVKVGRVVAAIGNSRACLEGVTRAVEHGFSKIKIKVAPGFDADPLGMIRSAHPRAVLAVDANGSYPPGTDLSYLDEFALSYLEQPFPADAPWEATAELRAALETRVCLDEAITGPPTARSAIALGACDLINLKFGRLGGFETARTVHDLAVTSGIGLVAGGLLETAIGRAHALAFARLPGFTEPADLSPPLDYLESDLAVEAIGHESGTIETSGRPGTGFEPDPAALERYRLHHETVELAAH